MRDLESLKREAKALHKAYDAGDRQAQLQVAQFLRDKRDLKHADFLHVIARGRGFESWAKLKVASEAQGLGRAEAQERLKAALFHGQKIWVDRLLTQFPDLAEGRIDLACALYDIAAVRSMLEKDPEAATRPVGPRPPLLHVTFSHYHRWAPDKAADALAVANFLLAHGADVNAGFAAEPDTDHQLSALYGALGHSIHLDLAEWLLEHGATPNDNECLYHACEQRDLRALRMVLAHGAEAQGTNALYRAMDFDNVAAVEMLLDAGADPNEGIVAHPSGPAVVGLSALHHAAQRMCGRQMFELLLARGARMDVMRDGLSAYAVAQIYGNRAGADALAEAGAPTDMPESVSALVTGHGPLDPAKLPNTLRPLATELAMLEGALPRVKELVAAGLEWDRPDHTGLTPVQAAGWQGDPEMMGYFLSLKPDLSHINGYGGTLLSTIIHGSENALNDRPRDHIACLELALREGVALPKPAIRTAGREDVVAFLEAWGEAYPGQVVEHGIA
ncbi:MAG: ankyrin repeat domain-containing protein [Pseudomonadota bacterium]